MRGIAALLVLAHHCSSDMAHPAASGYLAVDFFFLLSGFVIARAYDSRLERQLSFWQFAAVRVIRK
ncbi:MAG: hypothetical protein JWP52_4510 [Rhizobacter sp.]|nr:hypothetical protein [Rhizobacter sp.]